MHHNKNKIPFPIFILSSFAHPVVLSLSHCLVASALEKTSEVDQESINQTSSILMEKILLMPRYLGVPMLFLTILFDWYGGVISGKCFQNQTYPIKIRQINQWKHCSAGVLRDFIQFYERLTLFIYYSQPQPIKSIQSWASFKRASIIVCNAW